MDLRDKTVLVTGADGFMGSHLTEMLVREGCKVRALSLYNSFNFWGWLEDVDCKEEIELARACKKTSLVQYIHKIDKSALDLISSRNVSIDLPEKYGFIMLLSLR